MIPGPRHMVALGLVTLLLGGGAGYALGEHAHTPAAHAGQGVVFGVSGDWCVNHHGTFWPAVQPYTDAAGIRMPGAGSMCFGVSP